MCLPRTSAVVAAAVLALAGCTVTTAKPAPQRPADPAFVMSGAVVIEAATAFRRDDHGGCAGTGDFADLRDGSPVLVEVDGGKVPAGQLTDGRALMDGTCRFWFAARSVPAGHDRYRVWAGRHPSPEYGEAEVKGSR